MVIERKKLSDLEDASYNPRALGDIARQGLETSIDRFGLVAPPVWNKRTGRVVGGHQRLKVLREKGVLEVDVVVVDLDDADEKALNLALNNPAIRGEFTKDAASLIDGLQEGSDKLLESLKLEDLRWVLERVSFPGDEVIPPSPSGSKGNGKNSVKCPRCACCWKRKDGEVVREGKDLG